MSSWQRSLLEWENREINSVFASRCQHLQGLQAAVILRTGYPAVGGTAGAAGWVAGWGGFRELGWPKHYPCKVKTGWVHSQPVQMLERACEGKKHFLWLACCAGRGAAPCPGGCRTEEGNPGFAQLRKVYPGDVFRPLAVG